MAATPPPLGDIKPSNLYADMPSRTLWLGVSTAVDPNGAVLLADLNQTNLDIAAAESRANVFTSSQVATRAPSVHSHTAAQITDFDAAVNAAIVSNPAIAWLRGMIILWSGNVNEIGVGPLAGWALCDGSSFNVSGTIVTTPNLSDRFVIGVGAKPINSKNTPGFTVTSDDGAHTHPVTGTALTVDQLPAHKHPISLQTGDEAAHVHNFPEFYVGAGGGALIESGGEYANVQVQRQTLAGSAHSHPVNGNTNDTGSGNTHTHTTSSNGTHSHQLTSEKIRDTIPYYSLAYIMKL